MGKKRKWKLLTMCTRQNWILQSFKFQKLVWILETFISCIMYKNIFSSTENALRITRNIYSVKFLKENVCIILSSNHVYCKWLKILKSFVLNIIEFQELQLNFILFLQWAKWNSSPIHITSAYIWRKINY